VLKGVRSPVTTSEVAALMWGRVDSANKMLCSAALLDPKVLSRYMAPDGNQLKALWRPPLTTHLSVGRLPGTIVSRRESDPAR
jgi:hypothetical protein